MAGDLTKITVNLTPRAAAALEEASTITGDSKTDTVNRALQVYAFLEREQDSHCKRIALIDIDGSVEVMRLL